MKNVRVDVWSDIACPWCYVGKRRLEAALAHFPDASSVEIVWRAFELDPNAPRVRPKDATYVQRLSKKYNTSVREAQTMIERMVGVAAAEGLDFDFDEIQPGNTFDAHRLLHLAHERGRQDAVKERFMRAYMSEGAAIGDREVLERLASEAGLDGAEARAVLGSDAFSREVRADEEEARAKRISGVPFFLFAGRYGVSGAQPAPSLLRVLEKAWADTPEAAQPEEHPHS